MDVFVLVDLVGFKMIEISMRGDFIFDIVIAIGKKTTLSDHKLDLKQIYLF